MKLILGDCLEKLKDLDDNSVDSIVTDPPYHLTSIVKRYGKEDSAKAQYGTDGAFQRASKGFMGKEWDGGDIAFRTDVWKECYRVLKSGGHLLAFSHSRTYHRMGVAIEDAGFEIRDQIMWIYGSGFPKSHNVGKAVDKIQGNNREIIGRRTDGVGKVTDSGIYRVNALSKNEVGMLKEYDETKGNSQWEGWGTALKPAHEPIVMARKPLSEKSVAHNVLKWGTGAINIDESRIEHDEPIKTTNRTKKGNTWNDKNSGFRNNLPNLASASPSGRFPANVIFDEEASKILDEQSGYSKSKSFTAPMRDIRGNGDNLYTSASGNKRKVRDIITENGHNDSGGASRFFYCAKTSKKERNEGCDNLIEKQTKGGGGTYNEEAGAKFGSIKAPSKNHHPTVKPLKLMAYLVNLVTPKGGIVLDPFMGSGSTGKASIQNGFDFIGIERDEEYMQIAKARIEYEQKKMSEKLF